MTKKLLITLAVESFKENQIDEKKVLAIVKELSGKDLKIFIRHLKLELRKRTVYLAVPNSNLYNMGRKIAEGIFPDKKIEFIEDPSLILGMKIMDNDMEFDLSLKNKLQIIESDMQN